MDKEFAIDEKELLEHELELTQLRGKIEKEKDATRRRKPVPSYKKFLSWLLDVTGTSLLAMWLGFCGGIGVAVVFILVFDSLL